MQAHQILVSWNEAQATDTLRLTTPTNTYWTVRHVGLNDIDAKSTFESKLLFKQSDPYGWKSWDLTRLTEYWIDNPTLNFGVVLWATNEDVGGYDLRFHSSDAPPPNNANPPVLEVLYSTEPKSVYFLKDHLGSIRATVLDSATAPVIGYDDYDAWGYPLASRTKPIPNAYLQGASKNKFTGKERDEDFGLNLDYFGGRCYDWLIGRWPTVDPLWIKHPNVSPYVYVLNNPMILIDPDGQQISAAGPALRYVMFNSIVQNLMFWKPRDTQDYNVFLYHIQGKSLAEVTHEADKFTKSDYSAEGPDNEFKFIKDPAATNRILDMRHFIVIGQLGQGTFGLLKANAYGILVELGQIAKGNLESGANREDFYSNYLGSIFFHYYYDRNSNKTFEQQLREWLEQRKREQEEKREAERKKNEQEEKEKEQNK